MVNKSMDYRRGGVSKAPLQDAITTLRISLPEKVLARLLVFLAISLPAAGHTTQQEVAPGSLRRP